RLCSGFPLLQGIVSLRQLLQVTFALLSKPGLRKGQQHHHEEADCSRCASSKKVRKTKSQYADPADLQKLAPDQSMGSGTVLGTSAAGEHGKSPRRDGRWVGEASRNASN